MFDPGCYQILVDGGSGLLAEAHFDASSGERDRLDEGLHVDVAEVVGRR